MRHDEAPLIRLEDYRPSAFRIPAADLDIRLAGAETMVSAVLNVEPAEAGVPLVLDGDELDLVSVAIDGKPLTIAAYETTPTSLVIKAPPQKPFALLIQTRLDPDANTKLMGLYRSGGVYCTQCEADGFRRITYFLDRPDVLSVYTTRIEADRAEAPVLLGNGNPMAQGEAGPGRHFAVWHDPHPKPCYLFALVGGPLDAVTDTYLTGSGRQVRLGVHVQPGKVDRAHYAMDALKRSMRWDETTFGREYDLDVFNIVAVPDFNMGAMENKGLNIFNDKYVLASAETATDQDYVNIESIIAHEYFHNWTGNRITCRDWFQLCLKEGLTVFRDQEFSSDERSRPVKRIADVRALRATQFAEDSGPLAHPVRPTSYKEINNFYTPTVYEKGAEVIRMLKSLIGSGAFRTGMDLYFQRYDGTAATVDDFIACFAEASGRDLSHFFRWYEQAGTPNVVVSGTYDAVALTYRLELAQKTAPTPDQPRKAPVVIPIEVAFIDAQGMPMALTAQDPAMPREGLIVLDKASLSLTFAHVDRRPVPSLLRGFSAPVRLDFAIEDDDLAVLFAHDDDAFNRWQAAQTLAMRLMLRAVAGDRDAAGAARLGDAYRHFLDRHASADPAFAAQVLSLPSEGDLIREIGVNVDPDKVHTSRRWLKETMGRHLREPLTRLRGRTATRGAYSPDAASAGQRALRNAALDLLAAGDPLVGEGLAAAQLHGANNMTDRLAALGVLTLIPGAAREAALERFAEQYADEPLVLDKWFMLQAAIPEDETLSRIGRLTKHPAFSMTNPNRVRALYGTFSSANAVQFNRADGAGFDLVADAVIDIDPRNPQLAARLMGAFKMWRSLEPSRRTLAQKTLQRVAGEARLSRDLGDIVERSLA